jgi:mannitol-specific phosphotransferase system IIBC component
VLKSLQKQKQQQDEAAEAQASGNKKKKVTAAQLRVQKGMRLQSSMGATYMLTHLPQISLNSRSVRQ